MTILTDSKKANSMGVHSSQSENNNVNHNVDLFSNMWKFCHYYLESIQLLINRIPILLFSLPQYLFVNSVQFIGGMNTVEYENMMLKYCFSIYIYIYYNIE